MLPSELMSIREVGDVAEPYWRAASSDGVHLALEDGEPVLWSAPCRVSGSGAENWRLPDDTTLVVTDRRVGFLNARFDRGGGWGGFGVAGLAVATAANVVSRRRAAARSAGLVAAGQVRHEWLTGLAFRTQRAIIGVTDTYLDLAVATETGQTVTLWNPSALTEPLARWLAAVVAAHRLALPVPRTAAETAELNACLNESADGPKWRFPGDTTALIRAARRPADGPPPTGDRPMIAVRPFGAPSPDPETLPAYDQGGALVLEPTERVLWQGRAEGIVIAAATAARGREVFRTIWTTAGAAAGLTLTDRRLVYALTPAETGTPLPPGPLTTLGPSERAVIAGQVRHRHVPNILALDGGCRIVASVIDPPAVVIRVQLLFAGRRSACDDQWIRAIATERLAEFPAYAHSAPEKWAALQRQAERPAYADGHYGPAAQLPLVRVLGSDRPR